MEKIYFQWLVIGGMEKIELKVVGHDNTIDQPNPDGSHNMRFFEKGKGTYRIEFNEDNKPCLWKRFKNPFRLACMPYLDMKYVEALKSGKTILVDNDILSI